MPADTTTSGPYTEPYALTISSALSDDYLYTADVLVSQSSPAPVGMFTAAGQPQALFINAGGELCQIVPAAEQSAAGWSVSPVGTTSGVTVVAAGVHDDGTCHGFYADGASLYHIELGSDGTWGSPDTLPLVTFVRVTNNPATGALVAYGITANGDLQVVSESSGAWSATSINVGNSLAGTTPVLVQTDAAGDWVMAVQGVAKSGGQLDVYQGTASSVTSGPSVVPVTTGAVQQVLVGYWNDNSVMFLFTDSAGNLYSSVAGSGTATAIPNTAVGNAAAIVDLENMLHVYTVGGTAATLSVVHQTGWSNDAPQWAPTIPLNTGFTAVATDVNPLDAVAFFAIDGEGALWFFTQDPITGQWWSAKAQMPGSESTAYHLSTYRSVVTVTDANGNPVPGLPLSVTASTTSAIVAGGVFYNVGPAVAATVTTGAMGNVTISQIASSLSAPQLTISAAGLSSSSTFDPSAAVHAYLTGSGTLNEGSASPLPQFGSSTLQNATVGGQLLAPAVKDNPQLAAAAASGIGQAIQTQTSGDAAGIAGWALDLRDRGNPRSIVFATVAELQAYHAQAFRTTTLDSFTSFLDDVWEGIRNGAISVEHWVVNVADKTVSLATKIGDEIQDFTNLVISGIEDAVAVVQSIFAAIEAIVEDIIEWIEMLLDWEAIWNTKEALSYALSRVFPYLSSAITSYGAQLGNGFFSSIQTDVSNAFDSLIQAVGGSATLSGLPPSGSSVPSWLESAVKDIAAVQNNWLIEKIESYFGGGAGIATVSGLDGAMNDLGSAFATAFTSTVSGFIGDFTSFITGALSSPGDFGSLLVADFLGAARTFALNMLSFLDAVITDLLTAAGQALQSVGNVLSTPVQMPFLLGVVQDILEDLGISLDLSVADLFCLALAIPLTIAYKITHGGSEPFPGGTLPQRLAGQFSAEDTSGVVVFAAAFLTGVWAVFDTCLDAVSGTGIVWLNIIDVVLPALIGVFTWPNGDPFSTLPLTTTAEKVSFANWMVGWSNTGLDVALLVVSGITWSSGSTIARYVDPAGKVLLTVFGTMNLISGIVASTLGNAGGAAIASNVLGPMSNLMQFLRLDAVQSATDDASLAIKLVVDFFTGTGNAVAIGVSGS